VDRVSLFYTRAALVWLLAGVALGALMLSDGLVAGDWRSWFAPTHGHMLFVGWFLQFAVGVAYWLLPRQRTAERPLGYDERPALVGVLLLNAGLLLRVLAEPTDRMGYDAGVDYVLAASGLLQLAAVLIIVRQLWGRLRPRPARTPSSAPREP
jgi:hypothetical protein